MVKKLISILVSTRLTAFLFISFSVAMAAGTFIESWYGTDASKVLVYNATWFEIMMLLFVVNFVYNIKRYGLLRRNKLPVLLLHLSWILIIIGAGITRYIGYEGIMPIREGANSNQFLSADTYLTVLIDGKVNGEPRRRKLEKKILLSEATDSHNEVAVLSKFEEYFQLGFNSNFNNQKFKVEYLDFVENVDYEVVADENGSEFLKLVEASSGDRHDHYLESGQVTNIHGVLFSLNNKVEGAINITSDGYDLYIDSAFNGSFMRMIDQFSGEVNKNIQDELQYKSLYSIAGLQFVIPEPIIKGRYQLIKNEEEETNQNMLKLKISSNGIEEIVELAGGKGIADQYETVNIAGLDFSLKYGSLLSELPFYIKLNDFIAEKYPGTEKSYSSFMSKVYVDGDEKFDYDIYMNHILNYEGYRFFQASFDPDEKGTVLSVNHDFWGTWVTYIGYILLYLSMIGIFFIGKTRFKELSKSLEKVKRRKRDLLSVFALICVTSLNAQSHNHNLKNDFNFDSVINTNSINALHAQKFGRLIIQDLGGRMKPANTFSSELLRKVSKKDTYGELNSDQVMMSIIESPALWYNIPIIYLKRGNDSIRKIVGLREKDKYASLVSFFDQQGNYKISSQLEGAYRAAVPNQFQKDFIEVDKRVNLLYSALEGKVLRVFPIPGDSSKKWVSFPELSEANFKGKDSLYVHNILPLYFNSLRLAKEDGDYSQADNLLQSLEGFQQKYGADILP